MPRKKTTIPEQRDKPTQVGAVSVTLELDEKLYRQVLHRTSACGYRSVDEWLIEVIEDAV